MTTEDRVHVFVFESVAARDYVLQLCIERWQIVAAATCRLPENVYDHESIRPSLTVSFGGLTQPHMDKLKSLILAHRAAYEAGHKAGRESVKPELENVIKRAESVIRQQLLEELKRVT